MENIRVPKKDFTYCGLSGFKFFVCSPMVLLQRLFMLATLVIHLVHPKWSGAIWRNAGANMRPDSVVRFTALNVM